MHKLLTILISTPPSSFSLSHMLLATGYLAFTHSACTSVNINAEKWDRIELHFQTVTADRAIFPFLIKSLPCIDWLRFMPIAENELNGFLHQANCHFNRILSYMSGLDQAKYLKQGENPLSGVLSYRVSINKIKSHSKHIHIQNSISRINSVFI